MTPEDKTDIIQALRDVARGLEQGAPNALDLLQVLGTEMLVLALKANSDIPPEQVEALIRREILAITDSVARFYEHKTTEVEILNERLMRQFDPAMAWNEAINRAILAKRAAKEEAVMMTPTQQMMFDKFQVPTTMKALRNA